MALLHNLYNPSAEAQEDLNKLPTGEYVAVIIDSDLKPTNDNTGHYLALTYSVTEGPYKNRKHWENINLDHQNQQVVEIANRQFAAIREATGVPNPRDSAELHFRPHIIRIENYPVGSVVSYGKRKGQVRDREEASIKAWKALDSNGAPAVVSQGATPATAPQQSAPAQSAGAAVPPWKRNAA